MNSQGRANIGIAYIPIGETGIFNIHGCQWCYYTMCMGKKDKNVLKNKISQNKKKIVFM